MRNIKQTSVQVTLFNVFAGIAIFISCLGLFGLATYTAQVKVKEIGIRKVLGASVNGIVQLISRDFLKLVIIAIIIAMPGCVVGHEQMARRLCLPHTHYVVGVCTGGFAIYIHCVYYY